MIDPHELSVVDFLALLLVVLATRSGFRCGFGEAVWPMLRWMLVVAAGALAWAPLGERLSQSTGLSPGISAVLCYLGLGLGIIGIVGLFQRRFGASVLLAIPTGRVDGILGSLAGILAGTSGALIIFAVLNPFDTGSIDWNPVEMQNRNAIGELTRGIAGTARHALLEGSWCGRTLQAHLGVLLVQAKGG